MARIKNYWRMVVLCGLAISCLAGQGLAQTGAYATTVVVAKTSGVDYYTGSYANDSACIQAAINAVNALGGGTVLIREGNYTITSGLVIGYNNLVLKGVGRATKLTANASRTYIMSAAGSGWSNLQISDMYLDCNANTQNCDGVQLYGGGTAKKAKISNLYIYKPRIGIYLGARVDNVIIENNHIDTPYKQGLNIYGKYIQVRGNTVHDTVTEFGMVVTGISDITFQDNITYNNCADGIEIGYIAERVIVTGNTSYGDRSGVMLMTKQLSGTSGDIKDVVVSNNNVGNPKRAGIVVTTEHSGCKCENILIEGNVIHDCQDVSWKSGILVTRGLMQANITSKHHNISIIGNKISNVKDLGITVRATDGIILVSGNTVDDVQTYYGISIAASNAEISGNYINNTGSYGLREHTGSNNNRFINNVLTNCGNPVYKVGTNSLFINNKGYNPLGSVSAPAMPSSGTNYTNNRGYPCMVTIYGGTVTAINIGGVSTGLTTGSVYLSTGETISITYSSAPTWKWYGL